MNFYDVIRHLVENGPFSSDEHRQSALDAIDSYENPPHAGAPDGMQTVELPEQNGSEHSGAEQNGGE